MFVSRHHTAQARLLVAFLFGFVPVAAAVMAPFLAATGGKLVSSMLYLALAPVCHQLPERSFLLGGYAWGLCQRCCGIYIGILAAAALTRGWVDTTPVRYRQIWAAGATGLLAADAMLPYLTPWTNTPLSRFTSGIVFGSMVGSLLVPACAELLARCNGRHRCSPVAKALGGLQ